MAGELKLEATLVRDAIAADAPPQMTYVLLEATPTGAQVVNLQAPLNLCLVLDRSGSMVGDKLNNLKQAVKEVIAQLQPTDFISIVLFEENAEVLVPSQPAANKTQLAGLVDGIEERGGTQMSKGLELGLAQVRRNADPSRINKIVLLTDGRTWGDEPQCQSFAQQAGQERVSIAALGLGLPQPVAPVPGVPQMAGVSADDWNHTLLDGIAQASGGASDLIDSPAKIASVFQSTLRSAQASVVRNAELVLRLVEGVTPRQVWQVLPLITNLSHRAIGPRDVQVSLGDIEKNVGKTALIELTLPTRAPGKTRVALADVTYDVPNANIVGEKARVEIFVDYAAPSPENPKVMQVIERVSAHKLQTRALQDAQAGNVQGATQKLRQAATQLLNLGEAELAQTAMQEAQNLQEQGQMSSAGTKRLNYATRKLTQNLGQ